MKQINFFALVGIFSVFLIFQPTLAARLEQLTIDENENYVVIGAFAIYKNAARFAAHANKDLKLNAKFEVNPNRNLYYVYVLNTSDRSQAINMALQLRELSELADTWVYSGLLGKDGKPQKIGSQGYDINPESSQKMEITQADYVAPSNTSSTVSSEVNNANANPTAEVSSLLPPAVQSPTKVTDNAGDLDAGVEGSNFLFKIFRATDNVAVEGDVNVIDVDRSKKMGTYKGNVPVKVSAPGSKSGKVSFVCEVFGYRKAQLDADINALDAAGIQKNENGIAEVPFELVRLQKGDIAVMYNVYFFKDAAIMRPESRFEVNSLLEMLKENENYKIKIHGHTNGGAPGKIISMNKDSKNFFSLNDTKDGYGSAKQLSEERAAIIRNYLTENGIDTKRTSIKAWGGKRGIHDKHGTRAQENVRVEIEILEN